MITQGYIIGIDPDVEASGISVLDCETRKFIHAEAMPFYDAIQFLNNFQIEHSDKPIKVVIEDSDESVNWHWKSGQAPGKIAAIGRSVGMCHATFRHFHEICEVLFSDIVMQKPLQKCWSGPDRKITHEEISYFIDSTPKRTNPEVRDSMLLAWVAAGYPIRMKAMGRR